MSFDLQRVRGKAPGWRVEYHETLESTMRQAATRPVRTAVVAGEQTAGIGRHGHAWHSESEAGLYVSLVLEAPRRAAEEDRATPALTLALGLATAEAIQQATGIACDLRWPNDVMLDGRKAAGILVQLAGESAVAGIGINVNHAAFPAEIAAEATSLRLHAGRAFAREDVLACLLPAVESFTTILMERGTQAILDLFTYASSYASGRRVTVDGSITGVTAGLDPSGFLRVRKDDGSVTTIVAGGVRATGA